MEFQEVYIIIIVWSSLSDAEKYICILCSFDSLQASSVWLVAAAEAQSALLTLEKSRQKQSKVIFASLHLC